MTHKKNNRFNYLLVFALMLMPFQSGMAAVGNLTSEPLEVKKVCHEMSMHAQHHTTTDNQSDAQQHAKGCCDKDMNCQQQCADCTHCPVVSVIPGNFYKQAIHRLHHAYIQVSHFPDGISPSLQFRPPRA